ncbi:MAG: hypothetical protein B6I26_05880 [Desulfobacteraceae bacterium 4572_130]|nr:MAG: hypothetical protein B6I26_05880 [Desulfobacteraceae bacterium 4572_130]
MTIFQKSVLNKYFKNLKKDEVEEAYQAFLKNYSLVKIKKIKNLKEEEYQDGFLRDLFVHVLGYTIKPDDNYNLVLEFKNQFDGKKADGAILKNNKAIAVIELKSTKTKDLKTITDQAFNYKNNQPDCKFVITSNFKKLRFYIDYSNEYQEFDLFNLSKQDFKLLYLILSKNSIFSNLPLKLKKETFFHEQTISKQLYKNYSVFKNKLFQNLIKNNPQYNKLVLFKKSQKLLDRFLFILFAKDRNLLPPNSIDRIIQRFNILKEEDSYKPLYDIYKQYFGYMNIGRKGQISSDDIPAYNGGLFYIDNILDNLKIDDNILSNDLLKLSSYDFNTEIDVNILGHIFEHSLSEIEEITAEIKRIPINKTKSKRKKDGIFYTPNYITQYIVENTIGTLCREKRQKLEIMEIEFDKTYQTKKGEMSRKGRKIFNKLQDYKNWLLSLKILDPACGSGAFLNQALNFLINEHNFILDLEKKLDKGQMSLFDIETAVLENNLYGVDINEESVEIAKLSLWLRTASKQRKLCMLNNNIKCGNSLIDDPKIAGDKAFNWQKEFPEVFAKGGFDVVIGNPPYVNIANIQNKNERNFYKKHFITVKNKSDLYSIFTELGHIVLKKEGLLSFIFSNSWLGTDSFSKFRKFLTQNSKILELIQLPPNVFQEAIVTTVIIIFKKIKVNENNIILKVYENNQFKELDYTLKYKRIRTIYNHTFSFKPEIKFNIKKIKLNEIAKFSLGIKTSNDKKFILNKKIDEDCYPMIRGRNISRYYYNKPSEWIWYKPKFMMEKVGAGPRKLDYFKKEKIFIQDVAQSIISVYCKDFILSNDTLSIIYEINHNFNFKFILSIVNSNLINYWFKTNFQAGLHIKINQLQQIPISQILPKDQIPFIEKADKMLELNKELQKKKNKFLNRIKDNFEIQKITKKLNCFYNYDFKIFVTELKKQKIKLSLLKQDEWEEYFISYKNKINELQLQINKTDKAIDQMVYKLYKLRNDEIKIIETNEN